MEDEYKTSLETKPIAELTAELQKIHDQLELLFTMHNSLDEKDLTQGGGSPEAQTKYQECILHQRLITEEINKRHMLEMLK